MRVENSFIGVDGVGEQTERSIWEQGVTHWDEFDPGVVGVREPTSHERDVGDAANVARSRLAAAMPTADVREGDTVTELLAAIEERDPDVVLVGANAGTEGASGVGTTATALLEQVDRPVVVVPLPDL